MGIKFHSRRISTRSGLAVLASLLGATPAAAEDVRATLSVTATVVPACAIRNHSERGHAVSCSTGARVATMTARRHDEQPLDEAAAILGAPVRRSGDVVFTAPPRLPADEADEKAGEPQQRYLTITY
ncbi:MAG: hypothetical protein QOC65_1609 [Sphingomonadales bacterium]|nr:hypothetical protein [Sphingomonadales bacterium]